MFGGNCSENMKKIVVKLLCFAWIAILFSGCATYSEQIGKKFVDEKPTTQSEVLHEIVALGNFAATDESTVQIAKAVKDYLETSPNKTLLFLGDYGNVQQATTWMNLAAKSNISTVFLPGDQDWDNGLDTLYHQKKQIDSLNENSSYLPNDYLPIQEQQVSNEITLIAIDSEWFIQNWDEHTAMNKQSFLKKREDFFDEFDRLINKNQNKITVVAMHHPLFSNGENGGYFSAKDHLFPFKKIPLPVAGTLINFFRKTSGANPADTQYSLYQKLTTRLKTITKNQSQVVFLSAHENNLQYIETEGIKQIVSGAATQKDEARSVQPTSYTVGNFGFASLKVYKNNTVDVALHQLIDKELKTTFSKTIIQPEWFNNVYGNVDQASVKTSIYPEKKVNKSNTYTFLFGEHYRKIYGTEVEAKVADFTTLKGGLTPLYSFADNKSHALVAEDKAGKQYLFRKLGKSSQQFLQSDIFKDTYVKDQLKNTFLVNFADDYYTTMHPYAPLVLKHLSKNIALYHADPQLVYLPKQEALGKYNEAYGDDLFMMEARPNTSQSSLESFGNGERIISTKEMLLYLEGGSGYKVDSEMYLRARYFDFLIGDWDRNPNQWLWVEKNIEGVKTFQPISRDHDQAFVKIDGKLIMVANRLNPLKHIHHYRMKFPNPRWITKSAFPLDRILLQQTTKDEWEKVAIEVVNQLNNEVIDEAFKQLPAPVYEQYTTDIVNILKSRRDHLVPFTEKYYHTLFKNAVFVATNAVDSLHIETFKDEVKIKHFIHLTANDSLINSYKYLPNTTKELWVYGLDGNDKITVQGDRSKIKIKLIGGRDNDTYTIDTKNKVKVFDYHSEENTLKNTTNAKVILKDQYALNQYDFRKVPLNLLAVLPDVGYNRDNGVLLGLNAIYTVNKFNQNPYSQKHQFRIRYSFATSGVMAAYNGSFKDYSNTGFWVVEALATTNNFTRNFFGKTNFEKYDKELFKDNYYRVRTSEFEFKPGYEWKGRNGSSFLIGAAYESVKIEETHNRLIDEQLLTGLFDTYKRTNYLGGRLKYQFENYDDTQEPTIGFGFSLLYGNRFFTDDLNKNHQYIKSKLNFVVPLSNNKKLTWSSTYLLETVFGNQYHFYQSASIGANNGMRGFRQYRFIGNTAFVTSNDLRYKMSQIQNSVVPLSYGIYIGYDTGRIWNTYDPNAKWQHSYGAGLWLNTLNSLTAHGGIFGSKEETVLVSFGLGFKF